MSLYPCPAISRYHGNVTICIKANGGIMATTKLSKTTVKGALPANVGLDDNARQQICEILNKRLSDAFVLYTKTLNYHWNVTGIEFIQLHKLFEEQYEAQAEGIDALAERVRQL